MNLKTPARAPHLLIAIGAGLAIAARATLSQALLVKFRRDVRALNEGGYGSILSAYADDAVLRFNDGDHRWAGDHRGKAQIERFFKNFVAAGITGEIVELFVAGPPWRLTMLVRFDDRAVDDSGREVYRNRTVLLVRTRWGRVVHQEDFYEDTQRIEAFEAHLRGLGVAPIS